MYAYSVLISVTLADNSSQCCACVFIRIFSPHASDAIRTLSVKDDHHKYRLSYWYGLPLVMRTSASKPDRVSAKVKE